MRIAFITPEVAPFSKTGGLADVSHALPAEFEKAGHEVIVISPLYRSARRHDLQPTPLRVRIPLRSEIVEGGVARAGRHFFLERDAFYDRDWLYGTPAGDYDDNAARFAFLSRGALELLKVLDWRPNIVHVHDWQAALTPAYMRTTLKDAFSKTRAVVTAHNMAYQGLFWHGELPLIGLDWSLYNWEQMEFYGKISFLKAGLVFADAITTVSPTYAREIQTKESGCGLEGVLASRSSRLHGILNGVDYTEWDPATDKLIPAAYGPRALTGKAKCKKVLQERSELPVEPQVPLFGMIGRFAEQKGIDIFVPATEYLAQLGLQFVILGSGEARYQTPLERLSQLYPGKVRVHVTFDEGLAHLIEGGADFFLMASRYEPCGLNQMYSLRYGTVPVVRRTGGLADTVVDGRTGIVFDEYTPEALVGAVERAVALYADRKAYARMQREGMSQDFSWAVSARKYLELFERLLT